MLVSQYNTEVPDNAQFFENLGQRIKKFRRERGYSQEDMIYFGFSARHWQQIEAGRPITVTTLLRICEVFQVSIGGLVTRLDRGIYRKVRQSQAPRARRPKRR